MGEKCTTTMDSLQSRLNLERDTVVSFVTEVCWSRFGPHNFPPNRALVEMHPILYSQVLQDDQPSGLTPQRAERSFPRYLEATSPHQRILHRFRSLFLTQFGFFLCDKNSLIAMIPRSQAEAAVVAARLPLEDSDTEDSALSSNALSRFVQLCGRS